MSRKPEKILGVFGGLGPAASAEFMRLLAERAPVKRDQDHPVVYMYSNPQVPDRSTSIMGNGPSPLEDIRSGLTTLVSWGADLLAVPCNTAHYFIDQFRSDLSVPLVHIVEETVAEAVKASPDGAWLIATGGTLHSGLYQKEAEKQGYIVYKPDSHVKDLVSKAIGCVKAGDMAESGVVMNELVKRLRSERDLPVMAACTELPLAYYASGLPEDGMVSSLSALANACIRELY